MASIDLDELERCACMAHRGAIRALVSEVRRLRDGERRSAVAAQEQVRTAERWLAQTERLLAVIQGRQA